MISSALEELQQAFVSFTKQTMNSYYAESSEQKSEKKIDMKPINEPNTIVRIENKRNKTTSQSVITGSLKLLINCLKIIAPIFLGISILLFSYSLYKFCASINIKENLKYIIFTPIACIFLLMCRRVFVSNGIDMTEFREDINVK
ncbi:hypothetical protein TVAG_358290 [Trichomonas vaginalis G3]|uniref:Uncharacterized protein n=1 Tax=Trichomonas vaginalis (strain ATCC PRA-98 / G3) TaxID=412133 RepID=A2ELD7_TRIV3|nr:hypothetical protein TVAGG3_0274520 [Trichomonas vaginalis G3]EAY06539.1 hypothetical protein TVAG_358290 [Trichomonas vaginalis G3]KAI5526108.1 hypothetical protein TVAGG3_0274520 [Trichomonas vaginalis G3]|eukprot:XP_001318762.1 hypothetical protein [Trichomonas vaginalis G3]